MDEKKLPIAEKFLSIQGEGFHAGVPMAFVRLSGCPVGGARGICHGWDGKEFLCDTGEEFRKRTTRRVEHHSYTEINERLTSSEIVNWVIINEFKTLCITGGEPFSHDLEDLYVKADRSGLYFHVETSGTEPVPIWALLSRMWVTLSPKIGWKKDWYTITSDIKLLVTEKTSQAEIKEELGELIFDDLRHKICLQPIEDDRWPYNTRRAVELCKEMQVRLSIQMHKWIAQR